MNDHKGIAHDFKTRNYTSVISDILMGVPKVRELESASFPKLALTSEALKKNLVRSTLFFRRARQTADYLHMDSADAYIEENLVYLENEIDRVGRMQTAARDLERLDSAAQGSHS